MAPAFPALSSAGLRVCTTAVVPAAAGRDEPVARELSTIGGRRWRPAAALGSVHGMPAPETPWLLTRSGLLADGLSDSMIRRALAVGSLIAVLPGVYVPGTLRAPPDSAAVRRAIAAAVLRRLAAGSVLSHVSAAAVYGLPVPAGGPVVVHITRPPPAKSRRGRAIRVHRGALDADEVRVVDDLAVTSPVRTVLDCARTMHAPGAAVLVREAVDVGLVTADQLQDGLRRRPRAPGLRAATAVVTAITRPP